MALAVSAHPEVHELWVATGSPDALAWWYRAGGTPAK